MVWMLSSMAANPWLLPVFMACGAVVLVGVWLAWTSL
jgi:hypothetical protein